MFSFGFRLVADRLQVKAAGGVRSHKELVEMVHAGASRIGTSSGVAIVSGAASSSNY